MSISTLPKRSLPYVIRDLMDIRNAAEHALIVQRDVNDDAFEEGSFGRVFVGTINVSGRNIKVAIKYLRNSRDKPVHSRHRITRLLREVLVWRHLRHRNVAEFYGLDFSRTNMDLFWKCDSWKCDTTDPDPERRLCMPGIVTSRIEHDLLDYIDQVPQSRASCVFGLACGLNYIHNELMVHGDVRPDNVRVDHHGIVKIIDFGFSRIQDANVTGFTTTSYSNLRKRFTAPELLLAETVVKPTRKTDVYSFGMCMLQILAHQGDLQMSQPFNHIDIENALVIYACHRKMRPMRQRYSASFDDLHWGVMEACWHHDENERPTMGEVLRELDIAGGFMATAPS